MSVLPDLINRFHRSIDPVKILTSYFLYINKLVVKFIWRGKSSRIPNTILKEKKKVGGLVLSNFKTYYKALVLKTVWYHQKNRHIDQQNRRESPEVDPHK